MALNKRVKVGGSSYQGYRLTVGAAVGDYALLMQQANSCVINGITVIPDQYGAGDYFRLVHTNPTGTIDKRVIAYTVYNIGANAAWLFDFAALEQMEPFDRLILTYTNVAGVAMNVYTTVEYIGMLQ